MQNEIYCQIHQNYVIQFIDLSNKKLNLECAQCIMCKFKNNQQSNDINNRILIHDLNQEPQKLLSCLDIDENIKHFFQSISTEDEIQNQFKQWEQNMREIQKLIDQLVQQGKEKVDQVTKSLKELKNQLRQLIKYDEITNLIEEMKKSKQIDLINQIESQLKNTIENLFNDNDNIKQQAKILAQNYKNQQKNFEIVSIEILLQKIKNLESEHKKFLNTLKQRCLLIESKIVPNDYLCELFDIIKIKQKNTNLEIRNIYASNRDELNWNSLWKAIENKSNLLFILKSKNQGNYIFGGYTPLQFKSNVFAYFKDPTNTSFLFSYTHWEIYPLIQDKEAIHCSTKNAIWFGLDDLGIRADFQNGLSKLGNCYKWDNYQGIQSNHLFGGQSPNIQECEVFEIIIQK